MRVDDETERLRAVKETRREGRVVGDGSADADEDGLFGGTLLVDSELTDIVGDSDRHGRAVGSAETHDARGGLSPFEDDIGS